MGLGDQRVDLAVTPATEPECRHQELTGVPKALRIPSKLHEEPLEAAMLQNRRHMVGFPGPVGCLEKGYRPLEQTVSLVEKIMRA